MIGPVRVGLARCSRTTGFKSRSWRPPAGGLLRRGLAVPRTDVAVVLNVAADHLGEMGVHTLEDLTEVKFVVRRAGEHLVLNADDPQVRHRGSQLNQSTTWVSLNPNDELIGVARAEERPVAVLEEGELVLERGEERIVLLPADEVPITLGGMARYNITNALAAAATAWRLGIAPDAIRKGLRSFTSDAESNPGRLNHFQFGEVRALVDFAHNPHGMHAIIDLMKALPHKRSLILIGQAGDRGDEAITELASITAAAQPDRIIIKQMTEHLRGRESGDVVAMLQETLRSTGYPDERVDHAPSELAAVRQALEWAQEGDLLMLLSHAQRPAVLKLLTQLSKAGWRAGEALPEEEFEDTAS